jgi:hypothetical protein
MRRWADLTRGLSPPNLYNRPISHGRTILFSNLLLLCKCYGKSTIACPVQPGASNDGAAMMRIRPKDPSVSETSALMVSESMAVANYACLDPLKEGVQISLQILCRGTLNPHP